MSRAIEFSIKSPKLGVLRPSFSKTGDERKIQDENSDQSAPLIQKPGIHTRAV
jgi:hypothetical protein